MDPISIPTQIDLADGASLPPEVLQSIQDEIRRMSATSGIKVKELQIVVQTSESSRTEPPSNPETSDAPRTDIPHETFTLKVQNNAGKVEVQKLANNTKETAVEISDTEDENRMLFVDEAQNRETPDPGRDGWNEVPTVTKTSIVSLVAQDVEESLLQMDVENISEVSDNSRPRRKRGRPPKGSSPAKISTPMKVSKRSSLPCRTDETPSKEVFRGGCHSSRRPKRTCGTPRRFEDCVGSSTKKSTKKIKRIKKEGDAIPASGTGDVSFDLPVYGSVVECSDQDANSTVDIQEGRKDSKSVDSCELRNSNKARTRSKNNKQQVNRINDGDTVDDPTEAPLKKKRGRKPKPPVLISLKKTLDKRSRQVAQTESEDETKSNIDLHQTKPSSESQGEHFHEPNDNMDSEHESEPSTDMKSQCIRYRKSCESSKTSEGKRLQKPREQKPKCFECDECKRAFTSLKYLDGHTCGKPFACVVCDKAFRARYMLQRHIKHVHNHIPQKQPRPKPCKCDTCGRVLHSKAALDMHMKIHTNNRPYVCEHCSKGFIQKNNLLSHITSVHEMKKPYLCPTCGENFAQQGGLDYHIRSHLYVSRLQECAEIGFGLDIRCHGLASLQRDDVKCLCCDEMFSHLVRYLYHLKEHVDNNPAEGHSPEILQKVNQILDRNKDILLAARIFRCDECSKIFMSHSELRDHLRVHTAIFGYAFQCKYCDKRFGSRSGQQYHQRTHTDAYEFLCGHCNKGFATMNSLMRHCETYHIATENPKINHPRFKKVTDPDRFKCNICEKVFGSHYNLKVHQRTHSKLKPYTCPLCAKTFTDPSNMIAHGKRHHPEHPRDTFGSSVRRAKLKKYLALQEKSVQEETPKLEAPREELHVGEVEQTPEGKDCMDMTDDGFETIHVEIHQAETILVVQSQP